MRATCQRATMAALLTGVTLAGGPATATASLVAVAGHKGPHPFVYHDQVFRDLRSALIGRATVAEKRAALIIRLEALAVQVSTPGTPLNVLVTQGDCDAAD